MRAAAAQIDPSGGGGGGAPPAKSRLKRLFERQLLRVSPAERLPSVADKDESEPSSVCLDGMVRSFLEDGGGERTAAAPPRCCNCFHGGEASDDDDDLLSPTDSTLAATSDAAETIKGLVHCATLRERNLLADVSTMVAHHRAAGARKRDLLRLVAESLRAAGHDAAVCVSRWEKSSSHPKGEHAYIDVILAAGASERAELERVLVDVDFRSEFEVARPTKAYRAVVQRLPAVFVGKEDRLRLLVAAAADAARASLKKRGLHLPPWRKPEYMRAKWLSAYERDVPLPPPPPATTTPTAVASAGELAVDGEGGGLNN
uniref:DUF506 domain-containing protein n=1 Tax=Leersia perrieri TaxID=77586 RepID=A0A0D9VPV5_9ORYZ